MFRFKVTVSATNALRADVKRRVEAAAGFAAETVAQKLVEIVKSKIPSGGWYDIYKNALTYFVSSDGKTWAASGLWETAFSTFPAERTLLVFSGRDEVAAALAQYNPWPIDILPAVAGGYSVDVTARPASVDDVAERRKSIASVIESVKDRLRSAGLGIAENEFPTINGKVYADVAFMAKALEHGLAGFERLPHWIVAFRRATVEMNSMRAWIEEHHAEIQAIVDGSVAFEPKARQMPGDLEQRLR